MTLLQIAPPTREDVDFVLPTSAEELETLAAPINGKYADFDWTPIRYIHRKMATRETGRPVPVEPGRLRDAVCATA